MATLLHLYNTLRDEVTPFVPLNNRVTVYVCGITPYATTHLGHLFTYAAADMLIRFLEYCGYHVTYVQNLTDIDDAILREAQKRHEHWQRLGNRWTVHFIADMQALNIRPPDHYPRATEVIAEIITAIGELLKAGVAYVSGGSVYFHVNAWPAYGTLSGLSRQTMLRMAKAQGNDPDDPHKHDPLDFPLWQAQQPGEPAWESPWGPGRPGWHMECSTMARCWLGETVDIHGGGVDLLFPHHECERAQVESVTPQPPFVRQWFHTAMVRHAGAKMSKSLGNLVMARDLLATCSADGIRLYLARHHYRQTWEHDDHALADAERLAHYFRAAATVLGGPRTAVALEAEAMRAAFTAAMQDDLHTVRAVQVLEHLADMILQAAQEQQHVEHAQDILRACSQMLGLRLNAATPEARVLQGWDTHLARFR
jgi:L-cysteine:1D-myo-inositol 2-amino-2-deoxy-alpha-D-glucopyranoside ligase